MCQSYHRQCACGQKTSEIFFGNNVLTPSVVREVYCPDCSRAAEADPRDSVKDNGWILVLDREAMETSAPRMQLDASSVTADQVFEGDYVTWVGFAPEDNVLRAQEREELAQRYASDRRGHFAALKTWAMEREARLAEEGWRKARRSRA